MAWHPFDAHPSHSEAPGFIPVDEGDIAVRRFECCDAKTRVAARRHMSKIDNSVDRD
jgi:hypothetical protein